MDSRSSALRPSGMTRGRLPAAPFEAGSGAEKKKGPGGRRKSLKRPIRRRKARVLIWISFRRIWNSFHPAWISFRKIWISVSKNRALVSPTPRRPALVWPLRARRRFRRGSCRPVYVKRTFAAVFHLHEEGSQGNLRRTALIVDRLAEKAAKLAVNASGGGVVADEIQS